MLENLIGNQPGNTLAQDAILLNIRENTKSPILHSFGNGIEVKYFNYSKKENWYHVFKKLAAMAGEREGILVTNDEYEMIMLSHYNINKKVVQIVHDGYNVTLALLHGNVADAFICHSHFFYEVMCQLLPHRRKDIHFIHYGIPISGDRRIPTHATEPLKLVFAGRHDTGKGIFDLREIENILAKKDIHVDWLILGKGPETAALQEQWAGKTNVTFSTPATNPGVLEALSKRDVLVFPTKFEGFPVALLEAMSVGCVPVVSDLPGGIRELVKHQVNGFLCNMESPREFAEKIAWLHQHRPALETMSTNAYNDVKENFNVVNQAPLYHQLFNTIAGEKTAPLHHAVVKKIGSRLDQPWLPNSLTKLLRGV